MFVAVPENVFRPHFPECAGKVDAAGLISPGTLVT
jgi:hypothetical protein